MNLSEDEIFEKYAKQCKHCLRNTFLPMILILPVLTVVTTY